MSPSRTRGRIVAIESDADALWLRNESGTHRLTVAVHSAQVGDLVEVDTCDATGHVVVLTATRAGRATVMERTLNPRRRHGCAVRTVVEADIRRFFTARGFSETRTAAIVPCPGLEPHLVPFSVVGSVGSAGFLHTSPELAMKRLLVGGLERIYQSCTVFRDEPGSITHRREFTMLEWYRAYAGEADLMRDCEELLAELALAVHGHTTIPWCGGTLDLAAAAPRLTVRELFREHAGVDLVTADLADECRRLGLATATDDGWDELYFRIWLALIEPRLPADRPAFVTRYPASQAALAVVDLDPDGTRWARRFELYVGGLELGNAFEELTCPVEQRRRFDDDLATRARLYPEAPAPPIDEDFLAALAEGMPPSAGIAVGVDRLVMLLANEPDIEYTRWL